MAKKKAKPKPKKPTPAAIGRYWRKHKKRLQLQREAKDLEAEEKLFRDDVRDWLLSLKKSNRVQTIGKFTLSIKSRVSVAWKKAYIDLAGAEAAEELRESTPATESADIAKAD